MRPDDALIFCRFLQDLSSVMLWGAFAYLSTLVPSALAQSIEARLWAFKRVAVVIAFGATFAVLPIERNGRSIVYRVDLGAVRGFFVYLLKDCCDGRPELCLPLLDDLTPCCQPAGAACA